MILTTESEWEGMRAASKAVALTLKEMIAYAKPGMSTKDLDDFGASILADFGAKSAPYVTYGFPGSTCISVDQEFCHGIPARKRILKEGDLINIDVSAELGGYCSDNGASFVIGDDVNGHQKLVNASKEILQLVLDQLTDGFGIADMGALIEKEARKRGYRVIKNLGGHGIGRSLHEQPNALLNCKNSDDKRKFKKGAVVAIETFISTSSSYAIEMKDGWTMVGNKGGYMAQHEHTLVITDSKPIILTEMNNILL